MRKYDWMYYSEGFRIDPDCRDWIFGRWWSGHEALFTTTACACRSNDT